MKRVIRATTNPAVTQREKENAALARQAAAEGVVLLKNDGALPLTGGKVALYGLGVRHTNYGGSGSGETRPRTRISIEQGFITGGWIVPTQAWLDGCDEMYQTEYAVWLAAFTEGLKKIPKLQQMDYANQHPFVAPFGPAITADDAAASECDTAVYVLRRTAGEGADRTETAGDWFLTNTEKTHLRTLCVFFKKTVLVVNAGGMIDLSILDELDISAVVYASQGGMEAGNALFDVLTGVVNPCGKLTDTWAKHYSDYPESASFGYRTGDGKTADYKEGMFVGYRFFDSYMVEPRYPFGFGLSYTQFSYGMPKVIQDEKDICVTIQVKNTGIFAGRESVQVYLSVPRYGQQSVYQSLVAFDKTCLLSPGATETLVLRFTLSGQACYDAERSQWLLPAGDYTVRIGAHSRQTINAAILRLENTIITEQCEPVCAPQSELTLYDAHVQTVETVDAPVIYLDTSVFSLIEHNYTLVAPYSSAQVDAIIRKLSMKDRVRVVVGAGFLGAVHNTTFGAIGNTTSAFIKKGLENMSMCDGPQGLNLTQRSLRPKQNIFTSPAVPEALQYGMTKKLMDSTKPRENDKRTVYYQFCTAWPCETLLAQTWDIDLAERIGRGTAREMLETGVTFWLAPGMNIHRNPLGGRNFEYYSEDPFLTGSMGAAIVSGVQSVHGCFATPKHFAANNQETERQYVDVRIDERTLREIYLRGFRIVVEKAHPRALMSSYNLINGIYCPNNYDLLTKVLRIEWKFDGLVMTDWFSSGMDRASDALCIHAGNDLIMPGSGVASKAIEKAVGAGQISAEELECAVRNVVRAAIESNMYD